MAGLPGTGKTYTAGRLVTSLKDFSYLNVENARKAFGLDPYSVNGSPDYDEYIERICSSISNGRRFLFDMSSSTYEVREHYYKWAKYIGEPLLLIKTQCLEATAKTRIIPQLYAGNTVLSPNDSATCDTLTDKLEDLSLDLERPENNHVSMITYNTEIHKVDEIKVRDDMYHFVQSIKSILFSSQLESRH